jgi:hypothetical protein
LRHAANAIQALAEGVSAVACVTPGLLPIGVRRWHGDENSTDPSGIVLAGIVSFQRFDHRLTAYQSASDNSR